LLNKVYKRLWKLIIKLTRDTFLYKMLYLSWWHSLYSNTQGNKQNYFSAVPNKGAGIGHQMANWIAGYWFTKQFGLKFAHIPFSTSKWDDFLNFGDGEIRVDDLVNDGYKIVSLPLFDENDKNELGMVKKIIQSYSTQSVVFIAEQDQFYHDQYGVMSEIKTKFNKLHDNDSKLTYDKDYINIAIHVRRGDITIGQLNKNPNLLMRWQDNNYFVNVLQNLLETLDSSKKVKVYLFSQGVVEDFTEFKDIKNIEYCLGMNAEDSFLHMIYADVLITSKSSFSYKPALLSDGIKICPSNFWHGYPLKDDWILANEEGSFDTSRIKNKVDADG